MNRVGRFQVDTTKKIEQIRLAATGIVGGIFPIGNLQQSYIYIYIIHGVEELTFPYLLLGTFKNENNVLNTFMSVCNLC